MPYYGPRVGPGPIEDIGKQIAGAFRYMEEEDLREAEERRAAAEARAAEREADVYSARAYDYGLTPEGAEELPEEPDVTRRDFEGAGGVGPTSSPVPVSGLRRGIAQAFQQVADRQQEGSFERPQGMISEEGAYGGAGAGTVPGLGSLRSGIASAFDGVDMGGDTEERGLPPGDVRAPLGTPPPGGMDRGFSRGRRPQGDRGFTRGQDRSRDRGFTRGPMDEVVKEGKPEGIRLESGTVYRPSARDRDELVDNLMRAFPGVSESEAEVMADRRLGQTAASRILDRYGERETDITGTERGDRATTLAARYARQFGLDPVDAADIVARRHGLYTDPEAVRGALEKEGPEQEAVGIRRQNANYLYRQGVEEEGLEPREAAERAYQEAGVYPDLGDFYRTEELERRPQERLVEEYGRPTQGTFQQWAFQELQRGAQPNEIVETWVRDIERQTGTDAPSITTDEFMEWLEGLPQEQQEEYRDIVTYLSPGAEDIAERRWNLPSDLLPRGGG